MAENELSQEDIDMLLKDGDSSVETPAEAPESGEATAAAEPASTEENPASAPGDAPVGVMAPPAEKEEVSARPVEFSQLTAQSGPGEARKIDFLLDVPVTVTVELGRTSMVIRDALSLASGSVVELNKLAGEPVDLLINNKLVARAEVVVVNENFGVKVIDIVSAEERLHYLR